MLYQTAQRRGAAWATLDVMSQLNGDRARFNKDRKRKLVNRQRTRALMAAVRKRADEKTASTRVPDDAAGRPAKPRTQTKRRTIHS